MQEQKKAPSFEVQVDGYGNEVWSLPREAFDSLTHNESNGAKNEAYESQKAQDKVTPSLPYDGYNPFDFDQIEE